MSARIDQLSRILGAESVRTGIDDLNHYGCDWTRFVAPAPIAVVFPTSVDQLTELVLWAREEQVPLVPSGGRTGLSGGAVAADGELVVSFERMNQILETDVVEGSVTVQAGVVTAALHAHAEALGWYYPVNFASSGSSQIGGNIATNAGGIHVIRYGMTRDQVTGLTVVTGRGDCLRLNRGLMKNNTGYDLRHLFVGSEGTLGFIAEATLKLIRPPQPACVMLLALGRMADATLVLDRFASRLTLNAFEFFSERALVHVMEATGAERPFASPSPYYVLLEFEQGMGDLAESAMEHALAAFDSCTADALVQDGILAGSEAQNRELWQYREQISAAITPRTPYKNDLSVRVAEVPAFLEAIDDLVTAAYPDFELVWFGHIGDGNLHLNILKPENWALDRFKIGM